MWIAINLVFSFHQVYGVSWLVIVVAMLVLKVRIQCLQIYSGLTISICFVLTQVEKHGNADCGYG